MELFKEYNFLPTIRHDFTLPRPTKYYIQTLSHQDILSTDTIEIFEKSNLQIREVQLFVSPPFYAGSLHIDGHRTNSEIGCVNFILNNYKDWTMEWYESLIEDDLELKISQAGTSYMSPDLTKSKLIKQYKFEKCCALRIGLPHRVINSGPAFRYAVSLRFKNNNYDYIVEKLNDYSSTL